MSGIRVQVKANAPLFVEADADTFGRVFAAMNSEEQVAVLDAIAEHMRAHPTQWDHIAIELEKPEHARVRGELQAMLFPEGDDA